MRKIFVILAILMTITIFISGPAVAPPTWHYIDHVEYYDKCTNPNYAVGHEDNNWTSIGDDPDIGLIALDFGAGNEMGPSQDYTVFGGSAVSEDYDIWISETGSVYQLVAEDVDDSTDQDFTTPSTFGKTWRYILIFTVSGSSTGDPFWGPEIDAVGWYGT